VKAEEPKHEMELATKIEMHIVSAPRMLADPGTPFPQLQRLENLDSMEATVDAKESFGSSNKKRSPNPLTVTYRTSVVHRKDSYFDDESDLEVNPRTGRAKGSTK